MKCIVCDRCKAIIENPKKCRVITCAKPLKFDPEFKPAYRGNDRQMNDIIWEKELCSECADMLDAFMEGATEQPGTMPDPIPDPEPTPEPEPGGENTEESGGDSESGEEIEP